jgi:pantothenate synthetase
MLGAVLDVLNGEPALEVEYVEAVHPDSLQPVTGLEADTVLAVAVRVSRTRLIDNIRLGDGTAADERLAR